ncbi:unnamed protein product [Cuscuta campestris]|uniref:sphingosine kinase n=1 Tax=Cuscuta campestris TaxID=132261 RepID=A0A484MLS6_9ASTE|nr:unnamed protein product [Cuscuta campestris]
MDHGEMVLSGQVTIDGAVTQVTLTTGGQLQWPGRCLVIKKEVLGFSVEGSQIKIRAIVERGAGICCGGYQSPLLRKTFTFDFQSISEESLRLWSHKLQEFLDSLGRPKRLFVFVNPYGGKKSASKIFHDEVKPFLEDANIEYEVQETKYQLHAKEVVHSLDLSKYDGIVCVSGDGILVEVVNGLLEREDWETAIKTSLGVIPAGTGNGMAKSLLDSVGEPCTASNATLSIIRGHKRLLDVATISQGQTKFFSVLMLAWGLIADIDIESEKYRWMGSARIDFYALQRIVFLRRYNGCIRFLAAPGYEVHGEPIKLPDVCSGDGPKSGYCGPTVYPHNSNWRKIDGPFISVWLHNVPWGAEHTMAAPDAHFSDGYLDLVLIKDCPKLALLSLLSELNNGGHVKSPHVLYIKVKAFVLEPGSVVDDPSKGGIIDVDGEVLARGRRTYKCEKKTLMAYDRLHIGVDQGLASIFSPI